MVVVIVLSVVSGVDVDDEHEPFSITIIFFWRIARRALDSDGNWSGATIVRTRGRVTLKGDGVCSGLARSFQMVPESPSFGTVQLLLLLLLVVVVLKDKTVLSTRSSSNDQRQVSFIIDLMLRRRHVVSIWNQKKRASYYYWDWRTDRRRCGYNASDDVHATKNKMGSPHVVFAGLWCGRVAISSVVLIVHTWCTPSRNYETVQYW